MMVPFNIVLRGIVPRVNLIPAFVSPRLLSSLSVQTNQTAEDQQQPDKLYKMIELEMRGNDPAVLKSYSKFLDAAARELSIDVGKRWAPSKARHDRLTLLRSVHVNKKCRTQYEMRTYFSFLQLHKLTGSTSDTYLEYVQRNLPEGVAMKVTKVALEIMPEHIKPPEKIDGSINV